MSDWGFDWFDPDAEDAPDQLAEHYGFANDETAMEYYETGFLSSFDDESPWYTGEDVSPDDRHEAREAFIEWINDNYDDFDWGEFWEDWRDMYE